VFSLLDLRQRLFDLGVEGAFLVVDFDKSKAHHSLGVDDISRRVRPMLPNQAPRCAAEIAGDSFFVSSDVSLFRSRAPGTEISHGQRGSAVGVRSCIKTFRIFVRLTTLST
jgi:hypothetical protein